MGKICPGRSPLVSAISLAECGRLGLYIFIDVTYCNYIKEKRSPGITEDDDDAKAMTKTQRNTTATMTMVTE